MLSLQAIFGHFSCSLNSPFLNFCKRSDVGFLQVLLLYITKVLLQNDSVFIRSGFCLVYDNEGIYLLTGSIFSVITSSTT